MIQDVIKTIGERAEQEPDRVVYGYLGRTNTYGELKRWWPSGLWMTSN